MNNTEALISQYLLDIKAVKLSPDKPFIWASGWHSPIYCDNRKILSNIEIRNVVCDALCDIVSTQFQDVEVIAGVATGAIAMGMLVAHKLQKPFVYVRPKPKDHGTQSTVEGELPQGARVVVIEDLISTGGSALRAVDGLVKAGAHVLGMAAIFSYNFDVARRAFENANCELYTLSNYDSLLDTAVARNFITAQEQEVLKVWRLMPAKWNKNE